MYRADKLPPPPKESASPKEVYRWNYRLFEMLNGIVDIVSYQKKAEKGVASGYPSLDGTTRIPDAQIPYTVTRDTEFYDHSARHELAGADVLNVAGLSGELVTAQPPKSHNNTAHSTPYQATSERDAASGYAGLNAASRTTKGVDATDDVIVDLATKGLVLKDTQGTPHYWRVGVTTLGVLVTTDVGTVKP